MHSVYEMVASSDVVWVDGWVVVSADVWVDWSEISTDVKMVVP